MSVGILESMLKFSSKFFGRQLNIFEDKCALNFDASTILLDHGVINNITIIMNDISSVLEMMGS